MFAELTRRLAARPSVSAMAAALSVLIAVLGLAPALYASQVMGRFASHGRLPTLITISIGLAIALIAEMVFRLLRHRLLESVCAPADEELTNQVLARVQEPARPRALGAVEMIAGSYSAFRAATLMDLPAGFLYLAALWCISVEVGLAATICVAVVLGLEMAMGRISAVAAASREGARGRLLKPQGAASQEAAVTEWIDSGVHAARGAAWREGAMVISNNSAYCIVIAVGALLVVNSNLPPSALFGAGLLTSRAVSILTKIGSLRAELKRALPTMESVVRLLGERQSPPADAPPASPGAAKVAQPHLVPSISVIAGRRA